MKASMIKQTLTALAVASLSLGALANESNTAEVMLRDVRSFDDIFFSSEGCTPRLNQSWDTFSGPADSYRQEEKTAIANALQASACAVRFGYLAHVWLGELEQVKKDPKFRSAGLDAITAAASKRFGRLPAESTFNPFLTSVSCEANTPNIRFGNSFTQTVSVRCSTKLGPAEVNLRSMHVTVGGKDIWNGQNDEYLGRSIARALLRR